MTPHWREILKERLQLYGHRNWLVIADSAYPAQCRQAIETVVADEEQTTVLEQALAILGECKHVKANVYTDTELRFVREEDAPGIGSYREKLGILLKGYDVGVLPHEEIISKLDRVGEKLKPTCEFLILRCFWSWSAAIGTLRPRISSGPQCDPEIGVCNLQNVGGVNCECQKPVFKNEGTCTSEARASIH